MPEKFQEDRYYLDMISAQPQVQAYKNEMLKLLDVKTGGSYLDVGCGLGSDVVAICRPNYYLFPLVTHPAIFINNVLAYGVDIDEEKIKEAKSRFGANNLGRVFFEVGDAHNLRFPDNFFNGCRADRVFQHLPDPEKAISEMVRITMDGGRMVVFEPAWETLTMGSHPKFTYFMSVTKKVVDFLCCGIQNAHMGSQLYGFFKEFQLENISIVPHVGVFNNFETANKIFRLEEMVAEVSKELLGLDDWLKSLQEMSDKGQFFSSLTGFIVAGTVRKID